LENLRQFASRYNATIVDRRKIGGGLWIMMRDILEAKRILSSWGFKYSPDKGGWWKEDTE
jgi:hypothetical protein